VAFDLRTAGVLLLVLGLVSTGFAAARWWAGSPFPGYSRWALAGPLLVVAIFLLALRLRAVPDWLTMVIANAALAFAAMLYLEGAREFRSLPARSPVLYVSGIVAIGAVAFFVYIVPDQNGRATVMSAFIGGVVLLASVTLLRGAPVRPTFGLRLTSYVFAMFGATNMFRAVYCAFGPPLINPLSGIHGTIFLIFLVEWFLLPIGFMLMADEQSMLEIAHHISAEDALSTMSRRLIEAQEEERARVASELHDGLAQQMVALSMQLHSVARGLPTGTSEHAHLQQARDQAADLSQALTAMSDRLRSSSLDLLGLVGAAAGFCRELSEDEHLKIDFHHDGIPVDLRKDVALCLFRVLQEALTNALKHSRSEEFEVSLRGGVNEIELVVHDSGIGFDPERIVSGRGLGLPSMTERLKHVHGKLFIDSHPGSGATIHARVPLRN
jgi:signal transduction histidine kinase